MKNKLIILFLIIFSNLLLSEESQFVEITQDELFTEFLTNYKIGNQIEINGECLEYSVAKETGEILLAIQDSLNIKILFLDSQGKVLWQKSFESSYTNGTISRYNRHYIAENGSVIVITKGKFEQVINMVYDYSGNLLFENYNDNGYWFELKPTPDGDYFYEIMGATESRINGFNIYDKSGNKIELTGYNFSNEKWIRPVFITNDKVVIYMEDKILFFDFKDGNFNLISEYNLNKYHDFREAFQEDVFISNNYVLIGATKTSSLSILFDINGNFIREIPVFSSAAFVNSDEVLIKTLSYKNKFLKHINLTDDKILKNLPSQDTEYYGEIIELENELIVSRIQWDAFENHIKTFIFSIDSMCKIAGLKELMIKTDNNILFLSLQEDKCLITFGNIEK